MADFDESLKKLQKLQKRPDGVTSNEWRTILKGIGELKRRKEAPFDLKKHKAQTQSDLAKNFIRWYFATILLVLLYIPVYNAIAQTYFADGDGNITLINVKDVFMMVSGAITPILAFVLGHYFKGKD